MFFQLKYKSIIIVWCVGKKWLFWFCEGSVLCVGAKPNVPFAGWLKIVFKK